MKLLSFMILCYPFILSAETYQSTSYRTSLIELYTSEGCSSCPPAEEWLSTLYKQGFDRQKIVPLAFHVTYWDYLGWKDKFSKKTYDQRQRKMVQQEGGRTVYTPHLFLNGKTLRSASSLKGELAREVQNAAVSIKAEISEPVSGVLVDVSLERKDKTIDDAVRITVVAYQNDIKSSIKAGENEGNEALHQYVVREMQSAFISLKSVKSKGFSFNKNQGWTGLVIFVEANGRVLQALNIPLKKRALS